MKGHGTKSRAKEVVQQAFVNVAAATARSDERRNIVSFEAYVTTAILREVCRENQRNLMEHEDEALLLAVPASDRSAAVISEEALLTAVRRLPPSQRACVVLMYVCGYDTADSAHILRLPKRSVTLSLHRRLAILRRYLAE